MVQIKMAALRNFFMNISSAANNPLEEMGLEESEPEFYFFPAIGCGKMSYCFESSAVSDFFEAGFASDSAFKADTCEQEPSLPPIAR